MESPIDKLLEDYRSRAIEIYGPRLRGLYVFGSYARGQQGLESDVDLLFVLDRIERYSAEIDRTSQINSDLSLRFGVSVSRVFVEASEWDSSRSPFVQAIKTEAKAA